MEEDLQQELLSHADLHPELFQQHVLPALLGNETSHAGQLQVRRGLCGYGTAPTAAALLFGRIGNAIDRGGRAPRELDGPRMTD